MFDRDRFIAAQNSASVAATLLGATNSLPELNDETILASFENLRIAIFEGTLRLGEAPVLTEEQGARIIEGHFPGTTEDPSADANVRTSFKPPSAPPPAPQAPPPAPQPAAGSAGGPPCPKCGGQMWDNRASKRSAKAPDFKCKDKDRGCDGVIWPPRGR